MQNKLDDPKIKNTPFFDSESDTDAGMSEMLSADKSSRVAGKKTHTSGAPVDETMEDQTTVQKVQPIREEPRTTTGAGMLSADKTLAGGQRMSRETGAKTRLPEAPKTVAEQPATLDFGDAAAGAHSENLSADNNKSGVATAMGKAIADDDIHSGDAPPTEAGTEHTDPEKSATSADRAGTETKILLLDPAQIRVAGIEDRFDLKFNDLAESIASEGQRVPVIVRRDPGGEGFLLVAGRRRLAACIANNQRVRAEVQDLDEEAAGRTQLIETATRENLTVIERAKIAGRLVDDMGYDPVDLVVMLNVDRAMISRLLKIARNVPDKVAKWIGTAPTVGRPRWEALADALSGRRQLARVHAALEEIDRGSFATDEARFKHVVDLARTKPKPARRSLQKKITLPGEKKPIATAVATAEVFEIKPVGKQTEFNAWLADQSDAIVEMLLTRFQEDKAAATQDAGNVRPKVEDS